MKKSGGAEAHWSQLRSAHQLRVLLSDVQRKAREEELRIVSAAAPFAVFRRSSEQRLHRGAPRCAPSSWRSYSRSASARRCPS